MTVRRCPRCRGQSLVHTGAFWACEACRYAITQVALSVEHGGAPDRVGVAPVHGQSENNVIP